MRRRFRYSHELGRLVEITGLEHDGQTGLMIIPDLPAYESPIDGRVIEGRAARREDLKRAGCREYDPWMREEMARRQASDDAELEASVSRDVDKFRSRLSSRDRELLEQGMRAGMHALITRK